MLGQEELACGGTGLAGLTLDDHALRGAFGSKLTARERAACSSSKAAGLRVAAPGTAQRRSDGLISSTRSWEGASPAWTALASLHATAP
jgi:hypothetical protein